MTYQLFDQKRSWIEIDLASLRYNVRSLLSLMKSKEQFMAVIKADAYGHGAVRIAQELNKMDIYCFAVATLSEAIELRENGIQGDILILGYTDPSQISYIQQYHLLQTITDVTYALAMDEMNIDIDVHIAIDTGMHRLGSGYNEINQIEAIYALKHLHVKGIFSHLCVSDSLKEEDKEFTEKQIQHYFELIQTLKNKNYNVGKTHIQSSYGLLNYPHLCCDYVRIGISLYGVYSSPYDQVKSSIELQPVLSLKSKIILLRHVKMDETIGYGRTYKASKERIIAVVPIGYADGLSRILSNQGYVLVRGEKVPIVGRICMDQMMIDVSDIRDIQVGDQVTIIGKDGNIYQSCENISDESHTISNETLSRLGYRLPRIYRDE